jgi:molecular chaperone DnaJ
VEKEANLEVSVPPGIATGMRLRLAGEGESGAQGGPPGDLYAVLEVDEHDRFVREGADLHVEQPVSAFQAMLGGTLIVETILSDERELRLEAGSQPGDVIRLRGDGMPQLDSRRRGDLLVHLKVIVPKKLSAEQRELIIEAAQHDDDFDPESQGGFFDRLKRALGTDD